MSGDTDKAKISDNQDEDKKSAAGDGQTTEDESSQDSKGESVAPEAPAQGNTDVDQRNNTDKPDAEGDAKSTTANGKDDQADDAKEDKKDAKADVDAKKEENGETHDEDEKDDVKENDKAAKKPAPKKKPKKDDTEEEDEDEEEEEEEEEDEGDDGEDDEKPKEKVKKPAKKPKEKDEDEEGEEEEGDEEGEEEEEEEEEEEAPKPKPKKEPTEPPVPLPAGKGIPLGHISNVEVSLSRFKTQDQKLLHQYLYGQLCLDRNVKRNIKKFKGYEWAIGSTEYKAKLEETSKMEMKQLRTMCEMLDLDKKGSASELAARLVGFLQQPVANSPHARGQVRAAPAAAAATAGGRPRRSAAVKVHNRGYSDEEYESDPETKVKGPKPLKDGSESDGSFNPSGSEEADSDFDPEVGEGVAGSARKRKSTGGRRRSAQPGKGKRGRKPKGKKGKVSGKPGRGRRAKSDSEEESEKSESESENESGGGSDGEESDEPKNKRGRPAGVAKARKGPAAKAASVKATPVKRKAPTPPAKKGKAVVKPAGRAGKKGGKKASSESESGSEEDDDEGSDSGEESDAPADKKAKRPPTDDEIKKYVKQILEGANLEQITMKTVCKQVYSHYPDFDLAHKKDFIKATVKSLISS